MLSSNPRIVMHPSLSKHRSAVREWIRTRLKLPLILIALAGMPARADVLPPLSNIGDLRSLSRDKISNDTPIRIRGVVTWLGGRHCLTVQDNSAGIWVDFADARNRGLWREEDAVVYQAVEGTEIELEGRMDPGGYAPLILPSALRVLGKKPLPLALPMNPGSFFTGTDDCQRVEVNGVVQRFYMQDKWTILIVDTDPGRLTAQISSTLTDNPAALIDSEIRLRGVAATRFNTRGEATGIRFLSNVAGDLEVTKPPPAVESLPRVTLDRLLPFRSEAPGPHRVRVEGTVTYSLPGKFLYIQDRGQAVRVETSSMPVPKAGDRVEVDGFVFMSRSIGSLRDATVRTTGKAELPSPLKISPVEILDINRAAGKSAKVATQDYDGHLIRCRARLLAVESSLSNTAVRTLTLVQGGKSQQDNLIFRARLYDGEAGSLETLLPGSELEVTGLVELEFDAKEAEIDSYRSAPVNFGLILRGASDVTVVREPSWWTAERFIQVIISVLLALGGVLLWNLQLKLQVKRKSILLAKEITARRDAITEFRTTMRERNRLAANLHDTLPQSMSGIGLQLDACEISLRNLGIPSLPPLDVARRMVEYALGELRGAVWEMRSLSLRGRSFTAALQAVVDQAMNGHNTRISIETEGPLERIPDVVSGNLLLIIQEGIRNALQHGKPANITLKIASDAPGAPIRMTLSDDGCGFITGSQNGPEQGHYGLVGMRERAERLGGTFHVESSPAKGTEIVVVVSQTCEDESDLSEYPTMADSSIIM